MSKTKIKQFDLYGKRKDKYDFLDNHSIKNIKWNEIEPREPFLSFVDKDWKVFNEYENGVQLTDLFPLNGVGLTTAHDDFVIDDSKQVLLDRYTKFKNYEPEADELHKEFNVRKKKGWNILDGWNNLQKEDRLEEFIKPISYRPFDNKFIFYEDKLVWRTVRKVMQHFLKGENVGLSGIRINKEDNYSGVFISKNIIDARHADRFITNTFPLYFYSDSELEGNVARRPNLDLKLVDEIAKKLGLEFVPDNEDPQVSSLSLQERAEGEVFTPLDILDYIYAVLHSPTYRERYKEFLKIDFPRVPFTSNTELFWQLVEKGRELREYHLMEHKNSNDLITRFPIAGENEVSRKMTKNSPGYVEEVPSAGSGRVWINDEQYFDEVPKLAWEFYIGGYQPAQKWLKDRMGKRLSFEDILHYQKIIVTLVNTDKLMKEVDSLITEWPIL